MGVLKILVIDEINSTVTSFSNCTNHVSIFLKLISSSVIRSTVLLFYNLT